MIIWLVVSTPLKNMKVSWDDDYSQQKRKMKDVPNHQPVINARVLCCSLNILRKMRSQETTPTSP
jgi:hypothetical protein